MDASSRKDISVLMGACFQKLFGSRLQSSHSGLDERTPLVTFDKLRIGPSVTLHKILNLKHTFEHFCQQVKVGNFHCKGVGIALCIAPLHQDRAYFEIKVSKPGQICVGVSKKLPPSKLVGHLGNGQTSNIKRDRIM